MTLQVDQELRGGAAAEDDEAAQPGLAQERLLDRAEIDVLETDPTEGTARGEPLGELGGRLELHPEIVSLVSGP